LFLLSVTTPHQAVETLYELGFHYIGQIQSGNVFVFEDHYALGGFENALLGYKTSCYSQLQGEDRLEKMDAIMFGMCVHIYLQFIRPDEC